MPMQYSPAMRIISLIVLACFLMSCTVTVPKRFATLEEVYPPNASLTPPPDAPLDSFKKGTFEAPYEDVFRAVSVSASQAQFNVESTDKARGLILATRVMMVRNLGESRTSEPRQYSYAIMVKENGPKSSEVMVLAKVQQSCTRMSFLSGMSGILGFGVLLIATLPIYLLDKTTCDKAATVQWATGEFTTLQEMTQIMTFTRNNLIAAGTL